ncbi:MULTISPECIES: MarR family winged helix-turn-helix transcriptional regulator [Rhodomicrobium]|uniref:MarR family winged helix-turn-helix transcriptional regulator n=1 Tax=Rhodomicrobium TaxID=1068 RepID=UPI000B4AF0B5|nr:MULTISPECIES: MarR family winged helix-turn-helix transcriptional regulator [Rhodomicrobium]
MSTRSTKPPSKAPAKGKSAKSTTASKTATPIPRFEGSATHLLHRAEQCAGDIFTRIAPPGLLTPRQFAILAAIEADEGISQTGLVQKTGIDRSTLADIVRRMLEKDLVERERTAEDARAYAVRLTRKGSNMLKKIRPFAEEVDRRIVAAIPSEHRALVLGVLAQMVQTLSGEGEPGDA